VRWGYDPVSMRYIEKKRKEKVLTKEEKAGKKKEERI
jgi:hypothetical protein